jgi:molecular chaperone HtpG
MAKTKQFKTESKRLLDLMIHSIYTHKEIFLRELISNASDAIDKRHYESLTNPEFQAEYQILIDYDKEKRTLTITDNGIGLTEEELVNNLGTIAKSGSAEFQAALEEKSDLEIIGQFGVGFYSAFMVADKVEVHTRSIHSDQGFVWVSEGESSYTIAESKENLPTGTRIVLHIREDEEGSEDNYNQYLQEYSLKNLVKKYSDYVRYPIKMEVSKTTYPEKEDEEPVTTYEVETLNSMIPLWKKSKSDIEEKEYSEFYKHQFSDFEDPKHIIHSRVEGNVDYTSLLFIPSKAPYDLYSDKFEKGLQLYSKGVFIMEKNKDLLPDYFRFVKGLVDTSDLSLNISREMLQQNTQLKKIATSVESKIRNELSKMLEKDRKKYDEFYESFGVNLKYGIYEGYGVNKDKLKDLVMFKSLKNDHYITLKEYKEAMLEGQEHIYYASGKSKLSIQSMPQMDLIKKKDYDVLLFLDDIDEFMVNILMEYDGTKFKSVNQGELDLADESDKEFIEKQEKDHKKLINAIKKQLKDFVKDVKLSSRLTESPVCIVADEGLSLEMEKVLQMMPGAQANTKAEKILEINPNHELFNMLVNVYESDKNKVKKYAKLLYNQALLIEGMPVDNPVEFSNNMVELMIEASKN